MTLLLVDIGLALVVALLLSWVFLRFVNEHGPWRRPWLFGIVVFLFAWAGGAWIAPSLNEGLWVTYWIPFATVGLLAAVLIVTVSPQHHLQTPEDEEQFEREEQAVLFSVTLFMWVLVATLFGLAIAAYLR